MHIKKTLIIAFCCLTFYRAQCQVNETDAETQSFTLYNTAKWEELLAYGKACDSSGIDFPVLRMRRGYAAYMLGNYSQCLLQYHKVYDLEPLNKTALYYIYLCNLFLNNEVVANYYAGILQKENRGAKKDALQIAAIQTEFSQRMPSDSNRYNAQYARVGINVNIGSKIQLQQSAAYYTLLSNMPVVENSKVYQSLRQPEYYAKLIYTPAGQLSFIGAFHHLNDHFTDTGYSSSIFLGGVKLSTPYIQFQANASFGNFAINYAQYDGIITAYPLGNLDIYSISKISFGTQTTFTQVAGIKLNRATWLEGNVTLGNATYLFDNDGLYIKNDLDPNLFKGGVSIYTRLSKKLLLTLNYMLEKKEKYYYSFPNNYYQNSINGGLTWKF